MSRANSTQLHEGVRAVLDHLRSLEAKEVLKQGQVQAISKAGKRLLHGADTNDRDEMVAAVNDICRALMRRG